MSTKDVAAKPSLYERLGGVFAVAAVVDRLIERVLVNDVLNANPIVNERHHAKPKAGFKFLVTELVCQATGGPQRYSGMAMPESHRHLGITPAEWDAFLVDFHATLDEFSVPPTERAELLAIVESTRGDIVTAPLPVLGGARPKAKPKASSSEAKPKAKAKKATTAAQRSR
ncbi:group I truncated hemoglobin [Polyangium aurulentum]|uniref:group I truncated hemoglobin n=1 Tax=Polyangium aurulentum TaxID=2567896 RepID=UPI0010AE0C23|nr:group 1 truncated hemoglobin [Polyangium aurulentum]UQA59101.1 group 1 truncated hemoglobin [Polyangium aurulentum]